MIVPADQMAAFVAQERPFASVEETTRRTMLLESTLEYARQLRSNVRAVAFATNNEQEELLNQIRAVAEEAAQIAGDAAFAHEEQEVEA